MSEFGAYYGRLLLRPLPDGRLMQLHENFGFRDPFKKEWTVPARAKIDGASIPRPLWSLIGGPFEGKYRDASVIHDYYCDVRSETWRSVHRVFYYGMRTSGVSERLAKTMYAAVYFGGPRWSDTVVYNTRLNQTERMSHLMTRRESEFQAKIAQIVGPSEPEPWFRRGPSFGYAGEPIKLDINQLEDMIERTKPSLNEIDYAIDTLFLDWINGEIRWDFQSAALTESPEPPPPSDN